MRRAINTTVTRVTCRQTTLPAPDLLHVFPNAASLDMRIEDTKRFCAELERMASGNARLFARLHHLSVVIPEFRAGQFIPGLLQMLRR
jgi:hypothetical protein